jgi:Protein of unknown function (DUF1566)
MQQQRRRSGGFILAVFALGLLAGAALAAGPAQTVSGPSPYYAEPARDQAKGAGRFLVLTNWNKEAVLDKVTGLVWEKTPSVTATSWSNAHDTCANKVVGGRKGWRLPSVVEMIRLVDLDNSDPALPMDSPFIIFSVGYWSASAHAELPTDAWLVDFFNGLVLRPDTTSSGLIWCVRDGIKAEAY